MLTTWLVEIYLDSMGKLRDRGSFVDGFQEKIQTIREEFQRFLSLSKLRECLDLNKNTIYALISSHGALDDLVYFANLMQDYERLYRQQVAQGQYMVSDTRCPAVHDCEFEQGEAGQRPRRGRSPVEHRGTFVRPALPG